MSLKNLQEAIVNKLVNVWLEGIEAADAGVPWHHNPYGELAKSEAARLWHAGYFGQPVEQQ